MVVLSLREGKGESPSRVKDRNRRTPGVSRSWFDSRLRTLVPPLSLPCIKVWMSKRVGIRAILKNPAQRRDLLVQAGLFMQAVEGIDSTEEQMQAAYDRAQKNVGSSTRQPDAQRNG
jgi:hypothetical protein